IVLEIVKLLPLLKLLFLGIRNLPNLFFLLKKDYASGVILLAELEYLKEERSGKKIDELILHSQMTDMAILLGNKKVFTGFLSLCRWYGVRPAIFSNNSLYCIQMLSGLPFLSKDLIVYFPDDGNASIEEFAVKSKLDIRFVRGFPPSRE
ncbi:MAG: hypothetical protein AAB893_03655, partial [Patescibacteria group bacterium]